MIPIVTPETMRRLESDVMDAGTTSAQLIERAAGEIANYLHQRVLPRPDLTRSVVAVAGPGNNGVDAIVAASILVSYGWHGAVYLVDRENLDEHPDLGGYLAELEVVEWPGGFDVILDGIYGNSGRTELSSAAESALEAIEEARSGSSALVVAVDCPSGTNTLTGEVASGIVAADVTLCISNPKIGMMKAPARDFQGELVVLDIGVRTSTLDPEVEATLLDAKFVQSHLPVRDPAAHKSQIGGVLVVGGAPGYYGAPRLAGEAALRAGCGYVGLAVPRSIVGAIASAVPELIYHPLSDADGRRSAQLVMDALADSSRYNAIVCGPGIGRDDEAAKFLSALFEAAPAAPPEARPVSPFGIPRSAPPAQGDSASDMSSYPIVLDADALNWLSQQEGWPDLLSSYDAVLTPHLGEMARLLDRDIAEIAADPWSIAREAAAAWGQVVLLKNPITCVATPEGELMVAPRMTPELATPGTGDVLAGLVGAFIAQGCTTAQAAGIAIYVGAIAGSVARSLHGTRSAIARDIVDALETVFMDFDSNAVRKLSAVQ